MTPRKDEESTGEFDYDDVDIARMAKLMSDNEALAMIEVVDRERASMDFSTDAIKIIIESVRKELYTTKEWEEFKKDIIAALGEN